MTKASTGFAIGVALVAGIVIGLLLPRPWNETKNPPQTQSTAAIAKQESFESIVATGNQAMDEKRYIDAIASYDRALAMHFDPGVATDRGVCLRELGQHEIALAAFEFITLRAPEHWQARYNHAVVLVQMGRIEQARAEATRLRDSQPTNQSVQQLLKVIEQRSASH